MAKYREIILEKLMKIKGGSKNSLDKINSTSSNESDGYKEMQELFLSASSLLSELRAHDEIMYEHSLRVASYAIRLGRQMGLSEPQCRELYIGGLLHDIGKVFTPKMILSKVTPLTKEEYLEIMDHPANALKLISKEEIYNRYPAISNMVLHHHERIDGSGYPCGKTGPETSLQAKILGVSDCFDAMTSSRGYNNPLSYKQAIEKIRNLAGEKYEKQVVESFVKMIYNLE